MSKMLSRTFEGLDYDTREAAFIAARRSRKSLADWLQDVIIDKAGVGTRDGEDFVKMRMKTVGKLTVAGSRERRTGIDSRA